MASTEQVKKIVEGFVSGNHEQVINVLQLEADKLRKLNQTNSYKDIKRLISKVPASREGKVFTGASASAIAVPYKDTISNSLVDERKSTVMPDSVVLNHEVKNSIASVFREWEFADQLLSNGMTPTNRMIFYGPPGTGKTHLANAVAYQLDLPIMTVKLDELVSSHLGSTGKNIRDVFNMAHAKPSVLFIDEFDTLAKFRSDERELGELKRVVTVLLQHIDGFPPHSILVAATNHEEILDKAVWRRFQLRVNMELPNKDSVKRLIKLNVQDSKVVDIDLLSSLFQGLSGSDIKEICVLANKWSVMSGNKSLSTDHLMTAYLNYLQGNFEQGGKKEKYHLCQKLKDKGYSVKRISSISRVPYTTLRDNLK